MAHYRDHHHAGHERIDYNYNPNLGTSSKGILITFGVIALAVLAMMLFSSNQAPDSASTSLSSNAPAIEDASPRSN